MQRRGMTLVEMMIVIVIAGFLFVIALPRLGKVRDSVQMDSAAQQLLGDLRRLQVEAIKRNQSARLQRTGAATYNMDFVGARTLDGGVTFDVGSATEIRMASFGPPIGGGATFILESGTRQRTVTVSPAGLVSVQ